MKFGQPMLYFTSVFTLCKSCVRVLLLETNLSVVVQVKHMNINYCN